MFGSQDTYAADIARLIFPGGSFKYTSSKDLCLEVMEKVKERNADFGIVPFQNTYAGNDGVPLNYGDLANSGLFVCGMPALRIQLHLASLAGSLQNIKTVYMMKVIRRQCVQFMSKELQHSQIETDNIGSTPVAMDKAAAEPSAAGVGRKDAAEHRNLPILGPPEGIQNPRNYTWFFVLRRSLEDVDSHDNTLIIIRVPNKGGAEQEKLTGLIAPFHTAIIPEPKRSGEDKDRVWYIMQIRGKPNDEWVTDCLATLTQQTEFDGVRILGTCRYVNPTLLTSEPRYAI